MNGFKNNVEFIALMPGRKLYFIGSKKQCAKSKQQG
jgi:hypothetical protein